MAISLVAEYESAWNITTTPRTISVTTVVGDVLVACAIADTGSAALSTPTGGTGLTWTLKQSVAASFAGVWVWTASVATSETFTFSLARTSGTNQFGFNVLRFSGVIAVGASNVATGNPGTPSVSLTTTAPNSAVVVVNGDTSAKDGASRVWLTSAGAFTEQSYAFMSTLYTAYVGWHPSVGPVGAKTFGLSLPTSETYGLIVVELKEIPPPIGKQFITRQAVRRSYSY